MHTLLSQDCATQQSTTHSLFKLYYGLHAERSFACGIPAVVDLLLPSADAPHSVASHKRLVARVVSNIGLLDALLREDWDAAKFESLKTFARGMAWKEVPD